MTNLVAKRSVNVAVDRLLLDAANPRLPPGTTEGWAQPKLLDFMERNYNPLEVGRSIAAFGYFPSEPLIALRSDDSYTVLEGNRRLTALKLLNNPSLSGSLKSRNEWKQLAEEADLAGRLPKQVPVIEADNREEVEPILGYRHISGIRPWNAFNKARFVSRLVRELDGDFHRIGLLVGEGDNEVKAVYRNARIADQADAAGMDMSGMREDFGVFTRAMTSQNIREYLGAPAPSDVRVKRSRVPTSKIKHLERVNRWLYGDKRGKKVISESRDITDLGKAIGNSHALRVLERGGTLEDALEIIGGSERRVLTRLETARRALQTALPDVKKHKRRAEVQALVAECRTAARKLWEAIGS